MNGATTMSDGTSGLERRLQHEVPYSRYVNCSNHKLARLCSHHENEYLLCLLLKLMPCF